jgi:predicted DCC family thiol-disulfide oxidoreductase YuxK
VPDRLVLFDGECAVCNRGVQWILDHDPAGRFSFAPLQGLTGSRLLANHPEVPPDLDSIVLVRKVEGREVLSWHTAALLGIAAELGAPWSWGAWWAGWVPAGLRDPLYRAFARARYRVFGRVEECRLSQPGQLERFLA